VNVHRTALLALPAAHLFDVIEAAEHYPRFLPWCSAAHIVSRDDELVSADLQVQWAGMRFEMRTRNPKRRPEYMAIHLERGPFRRFEGEWRLTTLAPGACKVAFTLEYEFESAFMTRAAGPMFGRITDQLVDAFVRHAMSLPVVLDAPTAPVATAAPVTPLGPLAPLAPAAPAAPAPDAGVAPTASAPPGLPTS
jgi:ribosome-associated toxin RatA of RatAB toxin-antitoxin module